MINRLYFIFIGTIGWGASLSIIKVLLNSLDPVEIVIYRMAIGAATLFLIALFMRARERNIKGWLIDGIVIGTFNMSIPYYLTSFAETSMSSSITAVINALTPLFTVVLGMAAFSSNIKIQKTHFVCFLLGIIGVILIESGLTTGSGSLSDVLAMLLTCACYAISANYFKYKAQTNNPLLISALAALISTITMIMVKMGYQSGAVWHLPRGTLEIASLAWLGVIGSGITLYLYIALIGRAGPVFVSMVSYLMTLTGFLIGVIFLHESLTMHAALGCMLIMMSLLLLNHSAQIWQFIRINLLGRELA